MSATSSVATSEFTGSIISENSSFSSLERRTNKASRALEPPLKIRRREKKRSYSVGSGSVRPVPPPVSLRRESFAVTWDGQTKIADLTPTEQIRLEQIRTLFEQANLQAKYVNLNADNLCILNGRLSLIDPSPVPSCTFKSFVNMIKTYHCLPGDEIFNYLLTSMHEE